MSNNHTQDLQKLQNKLGYSFKNVENLKSALTHKSCGGSNNERLEFLGDSVLNCAIASQLYQQFPEVPEGVLTRLRAQLVCQDSLFELASLLDLGTLLYLGDGEQKNGGRTRSSILGDSLEAILGAIYLEAGFSQVNEIISQLYSAMFESLSADRVQKDAKSQLQEWLQSQNIALPVYQLKSTEGAAHARHFNVVCTINKMSINSVGRGSSRRIAEQAAAARALLDLGVA